MQQLSHLSLEYVPVQVTASVDPTGDIVQMAFVQPGADPVVGDWKAATWAPGTAPAQYLARCLVGTGGAIALAVGVYDVWVKVTDSPEVPVLFGGTIAIT